MSVQIETPLILSFRRISQITGILVTMIGGLALAGWILDLSLLKSVLPGLVAMKTNTAIGFILGGIATWALARRDSTRFLEFLGRFYALAVFTIGFLTLYEYIFCCDLGIDQWIFKEAANAIGTLSPNRMAPTTAFNFSILGIALFILGRPKPRGLVLTQILAFITFLMGSLTLIGYLYGVTEFIGIAAYTQMALHTALAFFLLGMGVFFSRPDQGFMALVTDENIGGAVARHMLPFAIVVPFLLGWLQVQGDRLHFYNFQFSVALVMITIMMLFSAVILGSVRILNRIDTLRKKKEAELESSEAKYKGIYEFSKDAIMLLDPQKGFVAGNPSTIELFGCKDEREFTAQSPASLSPEYQPDGSLSSEKTKEMMRIAMEKGSHFFEWAHKRLNGTEFFATVLLARMEIGGEKILQATVRDISERRKLLVDLEKKVETLERFQKITVGRELKMMELKTKVADLEALLKQREHPAG